MFVVNVKFELFWAIHSASENQDDARRLGCKNVLLLSFASKEAWLWLSKPMGYHFGVGEFTTHFRTCFSGWIDVHWGFGLWILKSPWPHQRPKTGPTDFCTLGLEGGWIHWPGAEH